MAKKRFLLGMLVMALAFGMTVVGCGDEDEPADNKPMGPPWTMVSNPPFNDINDIAFGGGKFIVVGGINKMAYSTDGVNWSLVNNLPDIYAVIIAYGGGRWVAYGGGNFPYYSTDGLNWSAANKPFTHTILYDDKKIAYGNGKFVIGEHHKIAYSTDGQTWVEVPNPPFASTDYLHDIAFGGGKFIVTGGTKKAYSTDGINWTTMSPSLFDGKVIVCIAYGDGKFVASGGGDVTAYSQDGINWTSINKMTEYSNYIDTFYSIAYDNGKWIGLGNFSISIGYSSDGINWTPKFNPPNISYPKVIYGNGKFVVSSTASGNGKIAYSTQ